MANNASMASSIFSGGIAAAMSLTLTVATQPGKNYLDPSKGDAFVTPTVPEIPSMNGPSPVYGGPGLQSARGFSAAEIAEAEQTFRELLATWRADTMVTSDATSLLLHPAHLSIIGLGKPAIPSILEDLSQGGGPWFTALEAITRVNPVGPGHAENAKLMRNDWLQWGRDNGYAFA